MEAKLKQQKVPQLKEILQQSGVAFKERENKTELIAKILASAEATRIANGEAPSAPVNDDDLLAPPEDFEWEAPTTIPPTKIIAQDTGIVTPAEPERSTKQLTNQTPTTGKAIPVVSATQPTTKDTTEKPATTADAPIINEDEEMEKRRLRAARFDIPIVEKKAEVQPKKKVRNEKQPVTVDDPEKLKARAEKYGVSKPQKRARSPAPVDAEEAEKRLRRAQRFGLPVQ